MLEFHKALYGEFIVIMIKSDDYTNGYINGTKLCKDGNKILRDWNKLDKTTELLKDFNIFLRCDDQHFGEFNVEFNIRTQNKTEFDKLIYGTYFHPDIIVHLASWISNEFAYKVSKIVNNYIVIDFLNEDKIFILFL